MLLLSEMYKRDQVRNRVNELKANMTLAEKRFDGICRKRSIKAMSQVPFDLGEGRYRIVDFYLPKPYGICIEIDGSSHLDPVTRKKDRLKDERLKRMNRFFRVVRIRNEQVLWRGFESWFMEWLGKQDRKPLQRVQAAQRWVKKSKPPKVRGKRWNSPGAKLSVLSWKRDSRRQTPHGLHLVAGFKLSELQAMGQL